MSETISETLIAQAQLAESIIGSQESSVEILMEYSSEASSTTMMKLSSTASSIAETRQRFENASSDEEIEAALEDFNSRGRDNDESLQDLVDTLGLVISSQDLETLSGDASERQETWQELEGEENA